MRSSRTSCRPAGAPEPSARTVYLLQRTGGRIGTRLGKTTGWVHRAVLAAKGVELVSGVNYEKIDDEGKHLSTGPEHGEDRVLAVDTIVVCAGQEPVRDLLDGLRRAGVPVHPVGGADVAAELDAKRDRPGHPHCRSALSCWVSFSNG